MRPDLTPAAIRNHEELFPGHVSKVAAVAPAPRLV